MTVQARVARRLLTWARWPRLTEVLVAWSILGVAYAACLSGMAGLRFTGAADHLAQPWPYANTIAYDPDGLYHARCAPNRTRPGSANVDLIRPVATGPCAR
jgi:hypothetical protein